MNMVVHSVMWNSKSKYWKKLTRLASVRPLMEGCVLVGIEKYGTLEMTVKDGKATVVHTYAPPDIILSHRTATQMLFGPLNPACMAKLPALLASWLPLPLSWNGQDRV